MFIQKNFFYMVVPYSSKTTPKMLDVISQWFSNFVLRYTSVLWVLFSNFSLLLQSKSSNWRLVYREPKKFEKHWDHKGSFTYYVRFLGGRESLRFCNRSNKEKIFSWKICNKEGEEGLKFRFFCVTTPKWTAPYLTRDWL